jgi:2,3-bisphosphoglycerate-independent phosphoglycerate mutase
MNPVPLVVTAHVPEVRGGGILADVAPTVLELLGEPIPSGMSGHPLI